MSEKRSDLMQFFAFGHLPPALQPTSQKFAELAEQIHDYPASVAETTCGALISWLTVELLVNTESHFALLKLKEARAGLELQSMGEPYSRGWTPFWRDVVLRLVLEAKDCAVRARIYKPVE